MTSESSTVSVSLTDTIDEFKTREKPKSAADQAAWSPSSWRSKPVTQAVNYPDQSDLKAAVTQLQRLPPLVKPKEIESLQSQLAAASRGERFVLQGGDCAEMFDYCNADMIEAKLKVLLQMSLVLVWGTRKPIVRIGRIAGQYAKPRSKMTEYIEGLGEVSSFRGDNVNGPSPHDRTPDPNRMVMSYFHSAATLNFIRASIDSGFASLYAPQNWDFSFAQDYEKRDRYQSIVDRIEESIGFMRTVGDKCSRVLATVDLFTSHEALLLEYEEALTREYSLPNGQSKYYDTSAHFVWIGDRTRQIDGAHVEFFRGIANPIGIKVGPSLSCDELVRLLDIVDPDHVDGRVTLITRYGCNLIEANLPAHIEAVRQTGHRVVWMSDPCHGNTKISPITKLKTRYFDDIMSELRQALHIHQRCSSQLNGVHLELTGDAVTECIGGSQKLMDEELPFRYDTMCDPRLSLWQSLDAAFLISDYAAELRALK